MGAQRSRLFWGLSWVVIAIVVLLCGWLMPIYLKAVDLAVLRDAGRNHLAEPISGNAAVPSGLNLGSQIVAPFLIRSENRTNVLASLASSPLPAVQELLRCRTITNTVLFPASSSASGQAFDTAVALCGLLLDSGDVASGLTEAISARASAANRGGDSQPIEEILMDELSLGQRFDWPHLVNFTRRIEDPKTLAILADTARNAGDELPVIYSAVVLSGKPAGVAQYLSTYNETGFRDLARTVPFGAGGVDELLHRHQRIYVSPARENWATHFAAQSPQPALLLKWFFYLSGGFFLALGVKLMIPGSGPAMSGYLGRELLFASGVLFVMLLVSEPFLAQENVKGALPFRFRLPAVGGAVASQIAHPKSIMNIPNLTTSLLTLFLFFVLQALIFMACLSRLNETLRQNVAARIKLKLLENEEHLFDAGLYLGFVGTIICLILVSLNILQFSLMAAYSSTSFGIIFVSILKIFKVRPARRVLLLQAEEESAALEGSARLASTPFATAP